MDSFDYDSKVKIAIRCLKYERDQHIGELPEASDMADKGFVNVIKFVRFYQAHGKKQQVMTSYLLKTTALVILGLITRKCFNRVPLSVFKKC
jgi:hypothetical protein